MPDAPLSYVPRVLIVEDEDLLRRILMMNLVRHGYSVTEADSVAAAREAIEASIAIHAPFDALLLDLNLPDQTGWDVLRWLKAGAVEDGSRGVLEWPKVIVMTAVRPVQCRIDEFRPDALLVKPFP